MPSRSSSGASRRSKPVWRNPWRVSNARRGNSSWLKQSRSSRSSTAFAISSVLRSCSSSASQTSRPRRAASMPVRGLRPTTRGRSTRSSLLHAYGTTARRPDDLQVLREVLVGPEQVRLEQIEHALSTPEMIGEVLPEAVAHASHVRPVELATAIAKPVTSALRSVARREPELFGEILAPTIGTAVRRAVTDALAAMLQRMNQVLERGLSLHSIKWRIEAKRTGRSFAEVVLAHSLVYRVEWAVLIHTESSLVLEQAAAPDAASGAPDQISAMLQAISSFVSEAFQHATPGGELHTLQVGDLAVWIERDPAFTLAVAIRGVPPLALRARLRKTIDRVRTLHHEEIADRVPDVTSFADTHALLVDCLEQ